METVTVTPENSWAKNPELAWEWLQKSSEEFEAWRKKSNEEFEQRSRRFEEWRAETERIVRRNSKQMGDLHRKFGKLAEHLVAPGIAKRFNERGYHFNAMSTKGCTIFDEQGNAKAQVDILLENGEFIIAVEVKTEPKMKDIGHHIKRLEILREARNRINDHRKIYGAIAGAMFGVAEKEATIETGLFVLEQSGDTMKLEIPNEFVPREW